MGTGASAEVAAAVQAGSDAEINEAIKSLNPETQKKLAEALAVAETDGAKSVSGAKAGPCSGPAPHLDEYFALLSGFTSSTMSAAVTDVTQMVIQAAFSKQEEKVKELQVKMKQLMADADKAKAPLRDIIRKSFDFHDGNKDGVLDEAESQLLFQHFVERFVPFAVDSTNEQFAQNLAVQMKQFEAMFADDEESIQFARDMLTQQMEMVKPLIMAMLKEKEDAYKKDQAANDKAAFAVLDTNGDGKLQKEEVVEGLFLDTDRYSQFMQALGLVTPEEQVQNEKNKEIFDKMSAGDFSFIEAMVGG